MPQTYMRTWPGSSGRKLLQRTRQRVVDAQAHDDQAGRAPRRTARRSAGGRRQKRERRTEDDRWRRQRRRRPLHAGCAGDDAQAPHTIDPTGQYSGGLRRRRASTAARRPPPARSVVPACETSPMSLFRPTAAFALALLVRDRAAAGMVAVATTPPADDYADVNQLLRGGKPRRGAGQGRRVLAGKPRDPQMRFLRGVILSRAGRRREAIAVFAQLTQDFPELPEPYNNLAVLYAAAEPVRQGARRARDGDQAQPELCHRAREPGRRVSPARRPVVRQARQLDAGNRTVAPKLAVLDQLFALAHRAGRLVGTGTGAVPADHAAACAACSPPTEGNDDHACATRTRRRNAIHRPAARRCTGCSPRRSPARRRHRRWRPTPPRQSQARHLGRRHRGRARSATRRRRRSTTSCSTSRDKHYDGTVFHRVIDGFMIQGGGFTRRHDSEKPTRAPIAARGRATA